MDRNRSRGEVHELTFIVQGSTLTQSEQNDHGPDEKYFQIKLNQLLKHDELDLKINMNLSLLVFFFSY